MRIQDAQVAALAAERAPRLAAGIAEELRAVHPARLARFDEAALLAAVGRLAARAQADGLRDPSDISAYVAAALLVAPNFPLTRDWRRAAAASDGGRGAFLSFMQTAPAGFWAQVAIADAPGFWLRELGLEAAEAAPLPEDDGAFAWEGRDLSAAPDAATDPFAHPGASGGEGGA
ncbi:hypothetical protein ACQ5SO_18015 [Rhodovulum sp. DZ06]|uniref:hypothetical protein n=1 Tax=Rhodovulum sp. DZ06 TaxID=3425126 RepID=UPI003D3433A3